MKAIHSILICCLLGLHSCSKDDSSPGHYTPYYPCYTGGITILSVKYLPIDSQEVAITNLICGNAVIDLGDYKLEHSSDTMSYDIPIGTSCFNGVPVIFPGTQLGFQIDTIADTLYLKQDDGTLVDIWYH